MYNGKLMWKTQPDQYFPSMFRGVVTKENGEVVQMTAFAYSNEKTALEKVKKIKIIRNNIK